MFALMVVASLGSVLIIFIGQNISKNKFDRIKLSLKYSLRFSLLWGVIVYFILIFFGSSIAGLFTDDMHVVDITTKYFLIVGASYGLQGLIMLSNSSFNGINKPYPAALFAILRMMVLYVPLAYIGSKFFGIPGIFAGAFIANALTGILSFRFLGKTINRLAQK